MVVANYDTSDLSVEVKFSRSRRKWTGTCYGGRLLIRVRINPLNDYPCTEVFSTGEYSDRYSDGAYDYWSQRLQRIEFASPEEITVAGFLHEFSHYLDFKAGLDHRWKQTKADKFATSVLRKHKIGQFMG